MIYFIQQGKVGPIKIGYTSKDDVKQRIGALQTASVEPLTLLGIMDGDEKQEKLIQQFFHAYRIRGEWFEPHPKILMYIMGLILGRPDEELFKRFTWLQNVKPGTMLAEINGMGLDVYLQSQEIYIIQQTLALTHWNITEAAKQLSISFRQLRHRISKYKINKEIKQDISN